MKMFTNNYLIMNLSVAFLLLPGLMSAQLPSVDSLKATNGKKGSYPAIVKQHITPVENEKNVKMNISNAYLGAVNNLQTNHLSLPSPGENSTNPNAPFVAGENIASAIQIPYLPYIINGTTCGFANDYDEICPFAGSTSTDVVYKYFADSDIQINIGLCNSSYDTKLFVYDNAYTPGSPMACNDDGCGSDYLKSRISNLNLVAGHWYYIVVDGYGSACGTYELDVVETPPCTPYCPTGGIQENEPQILNYGNDVVNGGCNYPPALFSPISIGQTICGQTNTYYGETGELRDTDWYLLDLTSSADSMEVTLDVLANFNLQIVVLMAPTGCSDYIALGVDTSFACRNANLTHRLAPGIYYIWIGSSQFYGYPPGVTTYTYTATLTGFAIPSNNACANATPVNEIGALPFNTTYASPDGPGLPCGSIEGSNDVWYDYTATFTGEVTVSLCGSLYDTRLAVFTGTSCSPLGAIIACNDDYCSLQSMVTFNVVSGSSYKILAGGYSLTAYGQGYLTIKPNCIPACPPDATPENEPIIPNEGTDITNGGCNYVPFNFSPVTLGQTYCGLINTYVKAGSPYRDLDWYRLDLSDATDSTLLTWDVYTTFEGYAVIIDAEADDCIFYNYLSSANPTPCKHFLISARVKPGIYYLVISSAGFYGLPPEAGPYRYIAKLTGLTIPSNDVCVNSGAIGEVVNMPFNTTAATRDGTGTCLASSGSRNIWHTYYPSCTGTAEISLCGSYYDTKMAVYEGTGCSPYGTLLGCSDDYCGLSSLVTIPVIFGHSYNIEIGGFNNEAYGQGFLSIQCTQTVPVNLNLQDIMITEGQTPCYNASNTITVGGTGLFTIISGGSVTMIAGQKIDYLPGTTVLHGGYLHGYINPTSPWCAMPIKNVISGNETGEAAETRSGPSSSTSFFKVYPNPTSGSFTLELTGEDEPEEVDVEIFGMYGEKVLTQHLDGQRKHTLNLDREATGIYILRVVKASQTGSVKIIKN
jgi:hypothetical protein